MTHFDGFRNGDFGTLEGSSWRGRDSLGGVLTLALRPHFGPECQSWGVRRRLELHLAKKSYYDFDDPRPVAKVFVYTHGECGERDEVAYGFYIEANDGRYDEKKFVHWQKFQDRIKRKSPLRAAIESAVAQHDLIFTDYYCCKSDYPPIGRFVTTDGQWHFLARGTSRWTVSSIEEFADAVVNVKREKWVNLHIYARMDQADAIKLGSNVVRPIRKILEALAPVYLETIA